LKVRGERATGPSAAPNDRVLSERGVTAVADAPDRGSMLVSTSRSVYRLKRYCDPRSL